MRNYLPLLATSITCLAAEPLQLSGIYPHLAMFNDEGECGTGAVVPWADRLWVITYAPHQPTGSSDKLYEITPDLRQIIRPESIGGTPANRMIHDESKQLFIGPYVIGADRQVRTIPYKTMFGRPTGNARDLEDPAGKILYATMEEGIYQVDVGTLGVTELWGDEQVKESKRKADLPGYHGKGFYSGQGVYVYANNGDHASQARTDPATPSGVLAEWDGKSGKWEVVRRNQFTDITGPGGIHGSAHPATDPIWAVGWDHRSVLLGVRMPEKGWSFYRLPKGSHSYDGAHGWNTEWPRIREIGENDLLMTMHGTFWKFPKDFSPRSSAGIAPRSNYLKVVGDFCRWGDRLVLGCDDTAKAEFLNKRKAKGEIQAPQSQSNLWFIKPGDLDRLGPVIGRGSVWSADTVKAGAPSDPFLFSGYDHRGLFLSQDSGRPVSVRLEVDVAGNGTWEKLRDVEVPATGSTFVSFSPEERGAWIRLTSTSDLKSATAAFFYRNNDARTISASPIFDGLAKPGQPFTAGVIRANGENKRKLTMAAVATDGSPAGYYEMDADLKLTKVTDAAAESFARKNTAIPAGILKSDAASVIFTDDKGKRWRLPKGDPAFDAYPLKDYRIDREVATERDLFNAHGSFYELPAENAGGFAKVRPVSTHNRFIHDYCSYRGLFVISGVATDAPANNPHIIRSDDGKTALWAGAIDDVWQLGKPRGTGGPWKDTQVATDQPSDPYLMTAYDSKSLVLSADRKVAVTAEVDLSGDGDWAIYQIFDLEAGVPQEHAFPEDFSAYWIRFKASAACKASALLDYR